MMFRTSLLPGVSLALCALLGSAETRGAREPEGCSEYCPGPETLCPDGTWMSGANAVCPDTEISDAAMPDAAMPSDASTADCKTITPGICIDGVIHAGESFECCSASTCDTGEYEICHDGGCERVGWTCGDAEVIDPDHDGGNDEDAGR